jgi:hypothetical protein
MQFLALFASRFYSVPIYVIWLGGIVYAIANRRKHPRTSLFAGIGLGMLLLENLASNLAGAYMQYQSMTHASSAIEMGTQFMTLSICAIPVAMVGWVLVLMAIFGWKNLTEREIVDGHAG